MITTQRIFQLLLITSLALGVSCSEEVNPNGNLEELPASIELEEFETDAGQIGISISARNLARKGYQPATAEISIDATGITAQTVTIDEFTNLATVGLNNEELPGDLEAQLKEGVPVEVTIKNKAGDVLTRESFAKLSFTPSPADQEVDDDSLPDLYQTVDIREEVLHYMQLITPENEVFGAPSTIRRTNTTVLGTEVKIALIENLTYPSEAAERFTGFTFRKVPNLVNTYVILKEENGFVHNLYMAGGQLRVQSLANIDRNGGNFDPIAANFENYFFEIKKIRPGLYQIHPIQYAHPLALTNGNSQLRADENGETIYFRILAFDIDWDIQALDAQFMQPIMPPSSTSSAYNSTLRNCSSGTLTQLIGETRTITSTRAASWSESMSVSSTNSGSVSLTLTTEAETKFFGSGGKTSASITGSYSYSKTQTQTNTRSQTLVTEETTQVSVSRQVGVPPGTVISVADVYQQYKNVKVPFVQRFRISGMYQENGETLSGQEILTQFAFNSFTGVVTNVQPTFIEVTVRGTTEIDTIVKALTESRDIAGACN